MEKKLTPITIARIIDGINRENNWIKLRSPFAISPKQRTTLLQSDELAPDHAYRYYRHSDFLRFDPDHHRGFDLL
ncbi:hypothetical protein U1Q18_022693 [Sarracenia purpurea var. burkii]